MLIPSTSEGWQSIFCLHRSGWKKQNCNTKIRVGAFEASWNYISKKKNGMLGFLDRFESVHVGTDEKCRLNAVNFWVGEMAILMGK